MREAALLDTMAHHMLAEGSGWFALSRQLQVGDIAFEQIEDGGSGGAPILRTALVIERKSAEDFASSLADGRYREQRARLLALRGAGTAVAYVIETPPWSATPLTRTWGRGRASLTELALQRHVARLQLHHGIPVFLSHTGVGGTAVWVRRLADMLSADPGLFAQAAAGPGTSAAVAEAYTEAVCTRRSGNATRERVALAILTSIPGVGLKAARAMLAASGGTVAGVVGLGEGELAGVTLESGRRLGSALAKAVRRALHEAEPPLSAHTTETPSEVVATGEAPAEAVPVARAPKRRSPLHPHARARAAAAAAAAGAGWAGVEQE